MNRTDCSPVLDDFCSICTRKCSVESVFIFLCSFFFRISKNLNDLGNRSEVNSNIVCVRIDFQIPNFCVEVGNCEDTPKVSSSCCSNFPCPFKSIVSTLVFKDLFRCFNVSNRLVYNLIIDDNLVECT